MIFLRARIGLLIAAVCLSGLLLPISPTAAEESFVTIVQNRPTVYPGQPIRLYLHWNDSGRPFTVTTQIAGGVERPLEPVHASEVRFTSRFSTLVRFRFPADGDAPAAAINHRVVVTPVANSYFTPAHREDDDENVLIAPGEHPVMLATFRPRVAGRCVRFQLLRIEQPFHLTGLGTSRCVRTDAEGRVRWRVPQDLRRGVNYLLRAKFTGDLRNGPRTTGRKMLVR